MSFKSLLRPRLAVRAALVLCGLALGLALQPASAASVAQANLVDLLDEADRIVIGTVSQVSDGFTDKNVPFTEITLKVSDSLRGEAAETLSFRQFGLLAPRKINGRNYLAVTPDGFPTWQQDEQVLVFLTRPASLTGLQTTVGLEQGKLNIRNGQVASAARDVRLFDGLAVDAQGLDASQREMLEQHASRYPQGAFLSLLRRAVEENWVETGVLRHDN